MRLNGLFCQFFETKAQIPRKLSNIYETTTAFGASSIFIKNL